jgi:TP901 family phage tail tape measure protein
MAADYAVSTSFRGKDEVSKSFRGMDRSAKRFGRTAKKSFRDATDSASRFRDVTKGILAAGVVQRAFSALSQGLRSVTEQFIDFDQATIGATARFKDIGPEAADFELQLKKIRDRAREAGSVTEFTAAQSAAALDFLARAGFSSAEAMGSLNSMINLATASGEDFASVADWSSDLLGAFGLNVNDTAQKIKNLNRLNDVLVKSANSANVTIESMFETMKTAGPISRITGTSLEEVAALTAALGNAGIKGTEGATALKNAMLRLAAPTGEVQAALDFLNITVDDGTGNMKKQTQILGEVREGLKGLGQVKQAQILNALFGKRAIAGAKNLIEALEGIEGFEKILEKAAGTSEKTADRMRKSLGNRLKAMGSAASELGFKILEAFEVRGEGAIDKLTEAIRNFDPNPIINGIEFVVEVFKNLWAILKPFKPFIPWFIGAWVAYGAVMKTLAIAQMVAGFLRFWLAIRNVAGGMAILNAVMIANPVGAIIIGITALIALLVLVVKHWDKIKIGFNAFVENFKLGLDVIKRNFDEILSPIFSGINKAMDFLGIGTTEEGKRVLTPPNKEEALARQEIGFEGRVTFENAPANTKFESRTTGAPPIKMEELGQS